MTEAAKSLLAVAVPPETFARFPPLLWRTAFDVSNPDDPRLALKAVAATPFSLIITAYPLPGMRFQLFLDEVRAFGSPCRSASVLAVTEEQRVVEASAFIAKGLNRVVPDSISDEALAKTIAELLEIAQRVAVRLDVTVKTTLWRKRRSLLAQTINVSQSGMLLRADSDSLEQDETISFKFDLPDRAKTVSGKGKIVRVGKAGIAAKAGLGVRFLEFSGAGEDHLRAYLEKMIASQSEPEG
jgi:CheY-like chemotaxis protein